MLRFSSVSVTRPVRPATPSDPDYVQSLARGLSSSMAVLDGDEIVYLARAATRRILSIGLSVGSRLPAACTSMG